MVKEYARVPDLSLYLPMTLALTPDALLLSKSKTGDITDKIGRWATLNMSGGVIKQCTATNQGLCACSFVDLEVIYNTGELQD